MQTLLRVCAHILNPQMGMDACLHLAPRALPHAAAPPPPAGLQDGDGPLAAGGASGAVGVDELLRRVRVAEKALAAGATAAAVGM